MPHGFFTIEQWTAPQDSANSQWIPILHLDSYQSVTKAMVTLEKRGKPGLYRIVQMQQCIWAEMEGGKLRLHGSHSSSPENLAQIVEIYERECGRWPVEKGAQAARSSEGQPRQEMMATTPNKSPKPAIGACRSAVAVHVTSRR